MHGVCNDTNDLRLLSDHQNQLCAQFIYHSHPINSKCISNSCQWTFRNSKQCVSILMTKWQQPSYWLYMYEIAYTKKFEDNFDSICEKVNDNERKPKKKPLWIPICLKVLVTTQAIVIAFYTQSHTIWRTAKWLQSLEWPFNADWDQHSFHCYHLSQKWVWNW